jgi:hypothetical protein
MKSEALRHEYHESVEEKTVEQQIEHEFQWCYRFCIFN